jgi:23S rRNA pseudouridine1911/1915/1917 synthase
MPTNQHRFVHTGQDPVRLDHFLVSQMASLSRSYIQSLIRDGHTTVNQVVVTKTGYKLESGNEVGITIPPAQKMDLTPEAIDLDIIHEDDNLIVLNKPAGLVVHPAVGHQTGTLVHALLAHASDLQPIGGIIRPGIIHRLDKDTSGILVVAKNEPTLHFIQDQFKRRMVEKKYLALTDGHPPTPTGRIEAAIRRDPGNRKKMSVVSAEKGRMAVSEYLLRDRFSQHSLLEVQILTGRTHQIRVHLAFLGCPVLGDRVYGHRAPSLPVKRQMLHAWSISFLTPDSTEPVEFNAPLPADFLHMLNNLRRTHGEATEFP